jgi:hypothetical protein
MVAFTCLLHAHFILKTWQRNSLNALKHFEQQGQVKICFYNKYKFFLSDKISISPNANKILKRF